MRFGAVRKTLAATAGLTLALTACGRGDDAGPKFGGNVSVGSNATDGKRGGTLKLIGQGDINNLDPASSYEQIAWGYVMRAITRQLVTYPNTTDPAARDVPVPDIAAAMPEVSADNKTYTFTLKPDVKFAPPVNRAIAGNDFIVGIKRLCDPNNPSGGVGYFTDTIEGFAEFCKGFAKVKAGDIGGVKAYIEGTAVRGLRSPADDKLIITLKQPAGDFLNILAMPFASPVASEVALRYLADSKEFRKTLVGSGPYTLDSYEAGKHIWLKRNENQKNGDPIRRAWVDRIEIATNGQSDQVVQQQIERGKADMYFGGTPPVAAIAAAKRSNSEQLHVVPDGCVWYLVMNLRRPDAPGGKALQDVRVRQALNYAYDKAAHLQVYGGETVGTPTGQILTSTILGHEKVDPYATPDSKGDVAKAKALLKAAGYENNLTLDYLYRPARKGKDLAATLQQSLKKVGITLNLKQVLDKDFYSQHLSKPDANDWDISSVGWCPDWPGNGARAFFTPLLDGRHFGPGTTNYGHYNNTAINKLADQALAERDLGKAAKLWHTIDTKIMADAPWVPVYEQNTVQFVSSRVKNWVFLPFAGNGDVTNVWIED